VRDESSCNGVGERGEFIRVTDRREKTKLVGDRLTTLCKIKVYDISVQINPGN